MDERQLELSAHAGEVVEPGTADLGAALGVDGPQQFTELEVVPRFEALRGKVAGCSHCVEHDVVVLTTVGSLRRRRVGQCFQRREELGGRLPLGGLGGLDLLRESLGPDEQRLLLVSLGLGDEATDRLLLGPQLLKHTNGRPAALVCGHGGIDPFGRLATTELGGAQ